MDICAPQQAAGASLFARVPLAPRDPILGLSEAFTEDPRPGKVNLGVGVYLSDDGRIPVLACVAEAERRRAAQPSPRGYLPIDGIPAYDLAVQRLLLGDESPLMREGRIITAQALGGTGALKIGADLLKRILPDSKVALSDPSWENHRSIFEYAGFDVVMYPYYDAVTRGLDFDRMLDGLRALPPNTIVVLHVCCHNPTGVDPTSAQWRDIVATVRDAELIPFLDLAYHGFGEGLDSDAEPLRLFAASKVPFLASSSFSKNFSLYGERVGALSIVDTSQEESARVLSQLKRVIRSNYSTPPTHGATIVTTVLGDAQLRSQWELELAEMRERIKRMRKGLVDGLKARGVAEDFSFILAQRGMFSYSGLTAAQVERLRVEFGIYAVSSGRICVAALNTNNLEYVAGAIAAVTA
jgi:aromatic-amino-acid transaminase